MNDKQLWAEFTARIPELDGNEAILVTPRTIRSLFIRTWTEAVFYANTTEPQRNDFPDILKQFFDT
jgi:hypothetical protein